MIRCAVGSLVVIGGLVPGVAVAQLSGSSGSAGYDASGHPYGPSSCAAPAKPLHRHGGIGGGVTIHGYPYGPWIAPPWGYPGLYGGPFVGYPGYFGYPGGRIGSSWSNGLSLYGPPVPVYGPIPGVLGNSDLERAWRQHPVFAGYGWIGVYAASPRHRPPSVSVWPVVESLDAAPVAPVAPAPANVGGCLILSVKVPQPATELFVDGQKTAQTGTDRIFESPPLEAGRSYKYTITARWVERGQVVESSREVTGVPGEVVRVDFGTAVIATRK